MVLVKQLSNGILPSQFLACLPKTCPFCGEDTQINAALTELSCTNPNCLSKLSERMVAMLTDLGVKNMGSSKCQAFINQHDITSPYALFEWVNPDGTAKDALYDGCSKEFSDGITAQLIKCRDKTLWEFVRIGNLPGIRDSAQKLFQGYSDMTTFYRDMEDTSTGGINFIANLLDIKSEAGYADLQSNTDILSLRATEVFRTLLGAKEELCYYQKFFHILTIERSVNICISTGVGAPYKSKTDFVAQMNAAYGSIVHINQLSSVTQQCDVLVWSKIGGATSKVQKATKYGIPIVTGSEFDKIMQMTVSGTDLKDAIRAVSNT